ncbi:MAG: periplasmic heavy metal sensor [Melioribacteraceae bacterium]|nr:periplasmic heavy metal sensor [Melioribacteraceae bacterium]MCF8354582.1 periplasmic heavy metal sensor [Melioribacteraceae bacterium]MCF8394934.1 periplasmic heavy metal sensor [Melioribacteraceae bacterium]MCF8420159.1 periplasmic heavy metal sensor [Melioribacteraceae bacterium]
MKKMFLLLTAAVLLSVTANLLAQPGGRMARHDHFVKDVLKLTGDQLEKFNQYKLEHDQLRIDAQAEIQKKKLLIKELMSKDEIDADEIKSFHNEISQLHTSIQNSRIDFWVNVKGILDEEQQEIWKDHFDGNRGMGFGYGHRFGRIGNQKGNFCDGFRGRGAGRGMEYGPGNCIYRN